LNNGVVELNSDQVRRGTEQLLRRRYRVGRIAAVVDDLAAQLVSQYAARLVDQFDRRNTARLLGEAVGGVAAAEGIEISDRQNVPGASGTPGAGGHEADRCEGTRESPAATSAGQAPLQPPDDTTPPEEGHIYP
jgi:hypothetical protein